MTTVDNQADAATGPGAGDVQQRLVAFLGSRTGGDWDVDQDLFASGAFSSLFSLELLQYVEQEFQVTVEGDDLSLDNFRTVPAITALVQRLRGEGAAGQ
ncbi:acyl carrier protein [Streptomyces chrestomyceticus]|uniref:acyl carrier protein n=1 Tax=Streptomyces chrestomyceticus TaxID=68185 RepID=UPI0019D0809D|nr:acyl carrier protein [Streptomyces chrestomyceticus]